MINGKFICIQDFMTDKDGLGLKLFDAGVYAVIFESSMNGSSFSGSLNYLCNILNSTRPTVISSLKHLVSKNYILKYETETNGVKFVRYEANMDIVKQFNQ